MRLYVALAIVGITLTIALGSIAAVRIAAPLVVMYYENQSLQNTLRQNQNLQRNCPDSA